MTVDLFSVKLKEVKRELTALKTAHKRGLDGLKIFEYPLQLTGYDDDVYNLSVTLTFDSAFTSYPFVSCSPQCDSSTYLANADMISMDYTNGGMGAVYVFEWFALTTIDPYTILFKSSVPIVDVSYTFVRSS